MEKEPKHWSEHPAYQEEDLEIKNEKELEEAKEIAGVTSHEDVIKQLNKSEEILKLIKKLRIKEGDLVDVQTEKFYPTAGTGKYDNHPYSSSVVFTGDFVKFSGESVIIKNVRASFEKIELLSIPISKISDLEKHI